MRKKGFTLIELLAVIAIIAILIVIILPNIMTMFNKGKEESFVVNAKKLLRIASDQYISDSISGNINGEYCYSKEGLVGKDFSNDKNTYYKVIIDDGKVVTFQITNGNYYLDITDNDIKQADLGDPSNGTIEIVCGESIIVPYTATYHSSETGESFIDTVDNPEKYFIKDYYDIFDGYCWPSNPYQFQNWMIIGNFTNNPDGSIKITQDITFNSSGYCLR